MFCIYLFLPGGDAGHPTDGRQSTTPRMRIRMHGPRRSKGPQGATPRTRSASHHTHMDRRPQQQVPKRISVPATT